MKKSLQFSWCETQSYRLTYWDKQALCSRSGMFVIRKDVGLEQGSSWISWRRACVHIALAATASVR